RRYPSPPPCAGPANRIRGRRRSDLEREGAVVLETPGGALVHGGALDRRAGAAALVAGAAAHLRLALARPAAADAVAAVRPVHLRLDPPRPGAAVNAWPARIRRRVFQGDLTQYH